MSFCLLFYQSVFLSSSWCRACWPLQNYLYPQLYHEMALRVADIAELILNVLNNGDAAPCLFLWLSGVKAAPALVLLRWMVHCSCLCISQGICIGWADVYALNHSLCPGIIQSKVMVLNLHPLLSLLDGWYTVHVSACLKAFALDEQMFARLVVLYDPAKLKAK